jgi:hypothetical protein
MAPLGLMNSRSIFRRRRGGRQRFRLKIRLDHDDFGSNRSKIMNVIDSHISRSGMQAENRYTLFLIPLQGRRRRRRRKACGARFGAVGDSPRRRRAVSQRWARVGRVTQCLNGNIEDPLLARLTRASILSGRRWICGSGAVGSTSCFGPIMPSHDAGAWIDFVQSAAVLDPFRF